MTVVVRSIIACRCQIRHLRQQITKKGPSILAAVIVVVIFKQRKVWATVMEGGILKNKIKNKNDGKRNDDDRHLLRLILAEIWKMAAK